jgi:N-acetylmuramoyl-L-alanine amidase
MEIKQRLIPKQFKKIRPQIPMKPKYITLHETGNTSRGATAEAHARLLERGNERLASWHYTVDDRGAIQHIPDTEVAWHAGDSHGNGNRESIGIEICVNQDGNFTKAKENAIILVQKLMKQHGIPFNCVVPHKKWSGKNCPERLLKDWPGFTREIQGVKVPRMIRVMVDGKAVMDSQIPEVLWNTIRQNLGKDITVKPREG